MTILQLSNPLSQNNTLAGGKGSSLAKMISAGLSVPDGFVLTTDAFSLYSNLAIDTLPSDFKDQAIKAFENIDAEYVAVRSSANCEDGADNSFAGQFDSFLNTTKDNLIENILKCWDSINSPRCQEYLNEKGIKPESVKVAVVVQKMIQSEVSGIAFTINPVTNDTSEIMIEAGYGLGEAIVSGQITPDNYLVDKQNLSLNEKSVSDQSRKLVLQNKQNTWLEVPQTSSTQQKLSDKQITELSKICLQIEAYYNHPCDIEWAFADGQFFVTQSRPVTTAKLSDTLDEFEKDSKNNSKIVTNASKFIQQGDYLLSFSGRPFSQVVIPIALKIHKQLKLETLGFLSRFDGQNGQWQLWCPAKDSKATWAIIHNNIQLNPSYFYDLISKYQKSIKHNKALFKKINVEELSKYSEAELIKIWHSSYKAIGKAIGDSYLLDPVGFELENYLLQCLENDGVENPKNSIQYLTHPDELSYSIKEENELKLLINQKNNLKKLDSGIKKHLKKWYWINSTYAGGR
jgi:Pyruvate phosphate dikinase, AMP/ATP-binding domain